MFTSGRCLGPATAEHSPNGPLIKKAMHKPGKAKAASAFPCWLVKFVLDKRDPLGWLQRMTLLKCDIDLLTKKQKTQAARCRGQVHG